MRIQAILTKDALRYPALKKGALGGAMLNISTRRFSFETVTSAVTKTIVTGLILFCGLQSAARASTIYSYTGDDFAFATSPYTTSDYVSGSFTTATPLADNLSLATITPSSYSFSDGVQTFSSLSPPTDVTFEISTNASGQITGWFINLENPTTNNQIFTESTPNREDGGSTSDGQGYIFYSPIGSLPQPTWQASTSAVPEPNMSWALFGVLTGGWAVMRPKRSKRQPE
jgi:hypothetical protein